MSSVTLCRSFISNFTLNIAESVDRNKCSSDPKGFQAHIISGVAVAALAVTAITYHALAAVVQLPLAFIGVVANVFERNPALKGPFQERVFGHIQAIFNALVWGIEVPLLLIGEEGDHPVETIVAMMAKDLFPGPKKPGFGDRLWRSIENVAPPLIALSVIAGAAATIYYMTSRWAYVGNRLFDLKPTAWEKGDLSEAELREQCPMINDSKWTDLAEQCEARPPKGYSLRGKIRVFDWATNLLGLDKDYTKAQASGGFTERLTGFDDDSQQMTPWCQQAAYRLYRCVYNARSIATSALSREWGCVRGHCGYID